MLILAGLGNPGGQYLLNRHNIGFIIIDAIASFLDLQFSKKFNALYAHGSINNCKILLVKPQTYMNNSGQSLHGFLDFYKIPSNKLYVFHDDLDLNPSIVKAKFSGGHGGHNGLRSIDSHIGKDYWRVRVGIGHPGVKADVSNYVLTNFTQAEQLWLSELLSRIILNLQDFTVLPLNDWVLKLKL